MRETRYSHAGRNNADVVRESSTRAHKKSNGRQQILKWDAETLTTTKSKKRAKQKKCMPKGKGSKEGKQCREHSRNRCDNQKLNPKESSGWALQVLEEQKYWKIYGKKGYRSERETALTMTFIGAR
ncbi:hypothetical protein C4D60_Mb06t10140 [Musa balbisiana]|uniref:Uncharacterized protein n=1 Tax=Musa balbisiana TaxID=52838 RepID=A0A4S8ILX6_MUSBA|nr:hypothetical protein C4D60_Mb06t10140 [Musa balbisiana]